MALCVIRFGIRAKFIRNSVRVNVKKGVEALTAQVDSLKRYVLLLERKYRITSTSTVTALATDTPTALATDTSTALATDTSCHVSTSSSLGSPVGNSTAQSNVSWCIIKIHV